MASTGPGNVDGESSEVKSSGVKSIDWSKWSSGAEILGAIAIFVTLLYLGVQTRYLAAQTEQNTQAINATAMQGVAQLETQAISGVIDQAAYERYEGPLVSVLGIDRIRNFWTNQSNAYNADFVAHVNSRIATQSVSPPAGEDFVHGIFQAQPPSQ